MAENAGEQSDVNEMQLESVHGSEEDNSRDDEEGNQTAGGQSSAGPSVKKQNAMKRDAEIK